MCEGIKGSIHFIAWKYLTKVWPTLIKKSNGNNCKSTLSSNTIQMSKNKMWLHWTRIKIMRWIQQTSFSFSYFWINIWHTIWLWYYIPYHHTLLLSCSPRPLLHWDTCKMHQNWFPLEVLVWCFSFFEDPSKFHDQGNR